MTFRIPVPIKDEATYVQMSRFPSSRYMGSKQAILPFIYEVLNDLPFVTVLDAFSGSAAVSYLLKCMHKSVTSNDFLHFNYHTARASVANSGDCLCSEEIEHLLSPHPAPDNFVQRTFSGLYYSDEENCFLDNLTANIREIYSSQHQSIALAALVRACLRRRPRGLFTYTGLRYDDNRRDLQISMEQQFREAVHLFNGCVFDNGRQSYASNLDVFALPLEQQFDLVYFDPPYVSPHSDNDYSRRYHFVEGLTRNWEGLTIQNHTLTKKFSRLNSRFDNKRSIYDAFQSLFERYQDSIIVVSYSSNGIPRREELTEMLSHYKRNVQVFEADHRYSFGTHKHKVGHNRNEVKEYLFVGTD